MSAIIKGSTGEQSRRGLFDEVELPASAPREVPTASPAAARVMTPQRDQIELRAVDLG